MRLKGKQIFYPIAFVLGFTPIAIAQTNFASNKSNNEEARGLLKRLENYEDKYIAPKKNTESSPSNVMAKQQEVLVSEVLRLRSQVAQLENQIAQGQEKVDFSQEEQRLITELTKERKRADDLEKQLAEEKSKDFRGLNRELEDSKSSIATERANVDKKDKLLKEANEKIASLEEKLQAQQDLKKTLIKVKNESEQLQLQLDSQKGLDTDNEYLKKSLAEEKQKSSDILKKSKELTLRITNLEQELKSSKTQVASENDAKIKDYQKQILALKQDNKTISVENQNLHAKVADYEKDIKESSDKEKTLKDSLKLTTENAKKTSLTNDQYAKQIADLEKQIQVLDQKYQEAKAQNEGLTKSNSELAALKGEHSVLQTESSQCQGQLKADQEELARLKSVEAELISVKNELLLKNTGAELLSAGPSKRQRDIRARATQNAQQQSLDPETQKKYLEAKQAYENAQKLLSGGQTNSATTVANNIEGEASVLTVVGSKVNLRNGPGMEHSPVMQISEGSKLTMETKEGEWYRVLTPTGSRAYIHQDEVSMDGGDVAAPAKAPIRGGADTSDLVPFGKVKVAGAIDTEDLAIQKLKAKMK